MNIKFSITFDSYEEREYFVNHFEQDIKFPVVVGSDNLCADIPTTIENIVDTAIAVAKTRQGFEHEQEQLELYKEINNEQNIQ